MAICIKINPPQGENRVLWFTNTPKDIADNEELALILEDIANSLRESIEL